MPAHQFPAGVVLGSLRRAELLDWAESPAAIRRGVELLTEAVRAA
jgi:DNA-binding transcriptional MocR family regulator